MITVRDVETVLQGIGFPGVVDPDNPKEVHRDQQGPERMQQQGCTARSIGVDGFHLVHPDLQLSGPPDRPAGTQTSVRSLMYKSSNHGSA